MCKDASSDEVEMVIKNAIGSADAKIDASACMSAQEFQSPPVPSGEASSRYKHLSVFLLSTPISILKAICLFCYIENRS